VYLYVYYYPEFYQFHSSAHQFAIHGFLFLSFFSSSSSSSCLVHNEDMHKKESEKKTKEWKISDIIIIEMTLQKVHN
jgi:hypothetical protein